GASLCSPSSTKPGERQGKILPRIRESTLQETPEHMGTNSIVVVQTSEQVPVFVEQGGAREQSTQKHATVDSRPNVQPLPGIRIAGVGDLVEPKLCQSALRQ